MKGAYWRIIPLVLFSLLIVLLWRGLSLDPQHLPSAQIGKPLPPFQLTVLHDHHKLFTQDSLSGQVSLLNVWASWCAACTDEQLFLLQLAHEGIAIYGLNYKDNTQNARLWLAEWGNPYKVIGEDRDGRVAIDLGVYGAPETFLIDAKGIIRYRHVGALDAKAWQQEFLPRLKQLERRS